MEVTERIIIEQLKRGNEEAYKYLYRHHYALLCHIAREYVGDDFLAETLVGDVIFHLWEIHEALDIQVSLRSYLVRAVRNHCMDYLSSKKERTEVAFSSIPEEGEMRYLLSDDYPLGSLLEHELEEERTRYDADRAFETFRKRVEASTAQKQSKKVIGWKTIYKYAAAVLVVGLISFFSYRQGESNLQNALTQVEVEAPLGAQTRLRLPDGTLVVLNAGSRLVYPQDFGVDNREVELSGEGYFEVERNEKLPFHVQTPSLSVRVLGTKFNFRDYPNDEEAVVSLLEGKVALDNRLRAEAEMILLPNEQVTLDKAEKCMKKELTKVKNSLGWTSGKLFFDETPLPEVVKILERSYDVHITFATDSLRDFRFYGSFSRDEQGINEILQALEKTGKVCYKQENKEITLY